VELARNEKVLWAGKVVMVRYANRPNFHFTLNQDTSRKRRVNLFIGFHIDVSDRNEDRTKPCVHSFVPGYVLGVPRRRIIAITRDFSLVFA
jgi:hypothetical protein